MNIPPWEPQALEGILILLLCTLGFTAYHFLSHSAKLKNRFLATHGPEKGPTQHVYFQRYVGLFSMGVIPALILWGFLGKSPFDYGVGTENLLRSLMWILGLSAVIIPLNFFRTRNPNNLAIYPMIREKVWSKNTRLHNAVSWAAYLLGYELMFRGMLLFGLVPLLGIWPAIAVNAALYALAHIPKNLGETLGAIPLGIFFCLLALDTGTIWIALFVHIVMAVSNSVFSFRHHPNMMRK